MKKKIVVIIIYLFLINIVNNRELFSEIIKKEIREGISHISIYQEIDNRKLFFQIIKIDLNKDNIKLLQSFDKDSINNKKTLSSMCFENDALLGINGSFFELSGGPVGLILQDKKIISNSIYNRAAFGVTENNKIIIDRLELDVFLTINGDFDIKIDEINRLSRNGISIFTREFGKKLYVDNSYLKLIVKNDMIFNITNNNVSIPDNGYIVVISKYIQNFLDEFSLYDKVVLNNKVKDNNKKFDFILSGGPLLLKDGEIVLDGKKEGFRDYFVYNNEPRTAVGITNDNKLIFFIVDGRQKDISHGMNLLEVSEILKRLNIKDALNFDGGGSTTLFIEDKIVNYPSDGKERKIFNSLLVKLDENG